MKLDMRHYRGAQYMVWGFSYIQIGQRLRVSPGTVRKWTRDASFQRAVQALAEDIKVDCIELSAAARRVALEVLVDLAEDAKKKDETRIEAARLILDRTGDAPKSGDGSDALIAKLLAKMSGADEHHPSEEDETDDETDDGDAFDESGE